MAKNFRIELFHGQTGDPYQVLHATFWQRSAAFFQLGDGLSSDAKLFSKGFLFATYSEHRLFERGEASMHFVDHFVLRLTLINIMLIHSEKIINTMMIEKIHFVFTLAETRGSYEHNY